MIARLLGCIWDCPDVVGASLRDVYAELHPTDERRLTAELERLLRLAYSNHEVWA